MQKVKSVASECQGSVCDYKTSNVSILGNTMKKFIPTSHNKTII